jgi:hypothetical protein
MKNVKGIDLGNEGFEELVNKQKKGGRFQPPHSNCNHFFVVFFLLP